MTNVGDLILRVESGTTLVICHRMAPTALRLTLDHVSVEHDRAAGETCVRITGDGTQTCLLCGEHWTTSLYRIANALHRAGYLFWEARVTGYMNSVLTGIEETTTTTCEGKGRLFTSDISALMEAVDKRRGDIVPCLLGAPGIGKTEGIEEFARKHGRNVVHIIASQILPTEVSGMTMPNQETHSMDVFDHARLSSMRDGDILFLDELLKGQQQVLSACLTLVQERRLMSGHKLPDVIIVAAANPLASAKMLPEEIRQRFLFVDVEFDQYSWCDYMRERGVPYPERLTRLLVTKGDGGADWNTLTPRTATKLTLWHRDSDHDPMVARVIRTEFGKDVLNAVCNALGYNVSRKKDPMKEVREFISQEMSKLPDAESDAERFVRDEVRDMLNAESINVPTLLERIQEMSGGNEIMEALRHETIDLSMTGIGEE